MRFALLIAAVCIGVTVAIGIESPFEHLPQAPQPQASSEPAIDPAPADEETSNLDDAANEAARQIPRSDAEAYK